MASLTIRLWRAAAASWVIIIIARVDARATDLMDSPETVVVMAVTPLPGTSIDASKIAGEIETLSVPELTADRQQDVLPSVMATQLSSVTLNDEQGSQYQPDLVYRGFEASPISGVAEGIAVYQDGVRLNEAFGDNVNWDLVPEFAVNRLTLQSGNPLFGLNSLGGAVTLEMKSGLSFQGTQATISSGSFGNVGGDAEYGGRFGNYGFYIGVGASHDGGFRDLSASTLRQAYSDFAYERGPLALHMSLSGALNDIGALGTTPVEMLAMDRRAVFTSPQSMHNEMELAQLHGTYRAGDTLNLSFNFYYRHFHQDLIDGNTTDVTSCANDATELCLEGDGDFPGDALYDAAGHVVPASVLPNGATPGETDFTRTNTNSLGAAAQASFSPSILGLPDTLVAGVSLDKGFTSYSAYGELGSLSPTLVVQGSGVTIDQALSPTAQPPIEAPVAVGARNTYGGLYALNVLDATPSLSWTLSGRLNTAQIRLDDRIGTALNGGHEFTRFDPGTGLTYKFSDSVTVYAGYSESNRAPTAGELSCADPNSPCLLDAFLVADPKLKQVVSRDVELGLRGSFALSLLPSRFRWNASFYRTNVDNDILLLATDVNGFGYFQNAGTTRRQGADLHLAYGGARWSWSASYSYLDATFRDTEVISSNSPAADNNGLIFVAPGNRMPMNPANRLTLSADYAVLPKWSLGADLRMQSGQYLAGDDSNQEPKMSGYTNVNLRTAWRITPAFQLYVEVQNLLDRSYNTYGTFTRLDGLPPNFNLADPRAFSPAPPRLIYAGFRTSM